MSAKIDAKIVAKNSSKNQPEKSKEKSLQKTAKKVNKIFKRQNYKIYRYNQNKIKNAPFQKPPSKNFLKKLFVFLFNFIYIFCVIFLNKNSRRKRWGEYG